MKKLTVISLLVLLCVQVAATVRLPSVLSDGMVILRNEPICIWGLADSHESFSLCWQGASHPVTADENGRWEVTCRQLMRVVHIQ